MNFYLKFVLAIYMIFSIVGYGCAKAEPLSEKKYPIKQCYEAKHGELNIDSIDASSPEHNAYLFDCAVLVSIPPLNKISGASRSKAERIARKERRVKIANYLLLKNMNYKFKNKYGDTLLMSVVLSSLPDHWKESTVKLLIGKGVDIKAKNNNGYTAMDIAKNNGNIQIVKTLSANGG